jgi:hypothetical protein
VGRRALPRHIAGGTRGQRAGIRPHGVTRTATRIGRATLGSGKGITHRHAHSEKIHRETYPFRTSHLSLGIHTLTPVCDRCDRVVSKLQVIARHFYHAVERNGRLLKTYYLIFTEKLSFHVCFNRWVHEMTLFD